MTSSFLNASVPWILLGIGAAIGICTLPRHPWVIAWNKRKAEQRILAELRARALTQPPPPRHYPRIYGIDVCFLSRDEVVTFDRIAEEIDYEWVTRALEGRREADQ